MKSTVSSHFNKDFFSNNRQELRDLAPAELIVIAANGLLQRGGDSTYGFCQDANFWYLTGIDQPDLVLVLDGASEYIIVPGRSDSRQAFDGALDTAAMAERSGITECVDAKIGWKRLGKRLLSTQRVASIAAPPAYIEHHGLYTNPARAALVFRLKELYPKTEIIDVGAHLTSLRMIKQPSELAALQRAIDITIDTLQHVSDPKQLATYSHEYQIEAAVTQGFRSSGAAGHGFDPIVANGAGAITLHNVANNALLQRGALLTLDVGAEVEHYSADITRTVALDPTQTSERQRAVHAAVWRVQQAAIKMLRPGVLLREHEAHVVALIGEQLVGLGLATDATPELIRHYCPHATSHFLGLNVHDVGDYDRPLEPGMVLTVEPGIYIGSEGIGVRIEDDVLVTKTGVNVLSKRLPSRLA